MFVQRLILFAGPIHAGLAIIAGCALLSVGCARHSAHSARAAHPAAPRASSSSSSRASASSSAQPKKHSLELSSPDEIGLASWYGDPYHGRRAASGEVFDKEKLTAAHRTLPFETWVEVTNLASGKSVQVRINDRGPFIDGRIIDLSEAAAKQIDMWRAGVAQVSLHVIGAPSSPPVYEQVIQPVAPLGSPRTLAKPAPVTGAQENPQRAYAVESGAFADRPRAEALAVKVSKVFEAARVMPGVGQPIEWRVIVGRSLSLNEAGALATRVAQVVGSAIVVLDPFFGKETD